MFKRIRDLREDNDLYQSDIADILHIARSQYQKYESGTTAVPVHVIIALAKYYDVSIDYLLGETNVKKAPSPALATDAKKALNYFSKLSPENKDYILGEMVKLQREQESSDQKKNSQKNIG